MDKQMSFGEYLSAKRRHREITALQMADIAGISPSYYCDIEKGRKAPPEREVLQSILSALRLSDKDTERFYDLAGAARNTVSPDLPDYIMDNEVVRVALRMAKEKANAEDWQQFIRNLERK